jgi:hypothetical protein
MNSYTVSDSHRPTPRAAARGVIHRNSFELTAEEFDVLTELQGEFDRLEKMKAQHSHFAAKAAFDAVRNDFIQNPTETNRAALHAVQQDRHAFFLQFEGMAKAIGASMRRHTALLEPEVAKVLKRLRPFVAEDLCEAKERERGLCATYGLPYEPSVVILGLESLISDLDATIATLERGSNVTHSARSLLARFDVELRKGAKDEDDEG